MRALPDTLFTDRQEFVRVLGEAVREAGLKLSSPVKKAILSAPFEGDESAAIYRDKDGNPEPDPEPRDTESVPLPEGDDPARADGVPESVRAFFNREVRLHVCYRS
ncbi:MAG TPA: hypothetical protein ENK43_15685 [Planctomycetes bacterium]|nr:hypothetical protein [Planctomycetota bacterium]